MLDVRSSILDQPFLKVDFLKVESNSSIFVPLNERDKGYGLHGW